MKILVVQESDWLKRNPHQQHHLIDRMSLRGHDLRVIDYPIDWRMDNPKGFSSKRTVFKNVHKVDERAKVDVIRPKIIQKPVLDYISILHYHKKEINKQIEEFKPDIIIALGLLNAYLAIKASKKHKIPFIYYLIDVLYTLIPEKTFQNFGKQIYKKILKKSDFVLTINQGLSENAIKFGADPDKIAIIDAGIDLKKYDPDIDAHDLKNKYSIRDDDVVLFFMGWIYNFAGMKELAIELAKNKNEYPNYKILIVGDGDAYEDLQKIRSEYDLADQLILTGKQPYDLISKFISIADFCLLPAYQDEEIMQDIVPIKIYEYMAMEKPVIATKLPGLYKEFSDNNGLIYIDKACEVLETAEKFKDDREKIGKIARNTVKENDWEIITDKFEKQLNELIK